VYCSLFIVIADLSKWTWLS